MVSADQREHRQHLPRAGWVEHDALEVWADTREVAAGALARADLTPGDITAVGITNQRETTVVWDRLTGEPVHHAIVWQGTRTDRLCAELGGSTGAGRYQARTGLPLSTYFAGPKIRWILDHVDGARQRANNGVQRRISPTRVQSASRILRARPSTILLAAAVRSSTACSNHRRASGGTFVHHFTLTRGPVEHRPDDVLTAFVLRKVGDEDVDRCPRADGSPDRADQASSFSRFKAIEDHEQVEVAILTFVATRY